jgi:regulator of replication initiation timing
MDDLRRESRRLTDENSACKARIAEIEASLAKLAASTSDSQVSPIIISIAAKAVQNQKLLSKALVENAELKQAAAEKEIENAQLTLRLRKLRRKVQTSEAVETQIRAKDREIADLKSLLREKEGGQEAQKSTAGRGNRAERGRRVGLPAGSDESDSEGGIRKSANDQGDVSMRDQNAALKLENEYLREKCQELANCTGGRPCPARAIVGPSNTEVPPDVHNQLFRRANDFLMKITLFESKFTIEVNRIDIRMGKLKTAYQQVRLLQKRRYSIRQPVPDRDDFLAQFSRTVGSLEAASHAFAKAHGFPAAKVPNLAKLMADPAALRCFLIDVENWNR